MDLNLFISIQKLILRPSFSNGIFLNKPFSYEIFANIYLAYARKLSDWEEDVYTIFR